MSEMPVGGEVGRGLEAARTVTRELGTVARNAKTYITSHLWRIES